MVLSTLQPEDIVQVLFQDGSRTLAQVVTVYPEETKLEIRLKGETDHIILDWSIPKTENQIADVPITEGILEALGFIKDKGWLYSLPEEEFWQKNLELNGLTFYEILKKEHGEWVAVERKDDAMFGCRFISIGVIRYYQRHFEKKYGILFPKFILERLFQ